MRSRVGAVGGASAPSIVGGAERAGAEAAAQAVNFGTKDTAEAIQAFLQKRTPTYRGR